MNSESFKTTQDLCLPLIEARLNAFFSDKAQDGLEWSAQMGHYHFSTGGKRLRALIPCWIYAAYGKDPREAIPLGCALELIHNATLVHDDLQDGDLVRRGKATVWAKFGNAQAINCGDSLFYFSIQMLSEMNLPAKSFQKITLRLIQGALQVIEGQAQEFLMKSEVEPKLKRYLGVIRGKTAALIATAVVSSLEALGVEPDACARAEEVALESGILFQIQDDLLDIYGDKARDQRATDIAEGKISALIASLNEVANPQDRNRVSEILKTERAQTTDNQINEVLQLFDKYDIQGAVLKQVRASISRAESHALLRENPALHEFWGFLLEVNSLFLKPIQHLL